MKNNKKNNFDLSSLSYEELLQLEEKINDEITGFEYIDYISIVDCDEVIYLVDNNTEDYYYDEETNEISELVSWLTLDDDTLIDNPNKACNLRYFLTENGFDVSKLSFMRTTEIIKIVDYISIQRKKSSQKTKTML